MPQGPVTVRELREKFLRFFVSKEHRIFPSGSLIPYDVTGRLDESLLFNGAGMIQFKPYFLGTAKPEHTRLATAQKCVRASDIEEVGDASHLTFFEMMGNFSFGDYFSEEAIALSWEFITEPEWLGLEPNRCAFTIFEEDDSSYHAWAAKLESVGVKPETRIFRLTEESNFWPAGAWTKGPPGPCGPNSEMFYWVSSEPAPSGSYTREDFLRDEAEGKWLEFWNDVFIQYNWRGHLREPGNPSAGYEKEGADKLPFRSVDTGMGLERAVVVLSGGAYKSVYDTDAFQPILARISQLAPGENDGDRVRAKRIVADHMRTACFCIADGILPSNTGRGYVLRRLIRRAIAQGFRVLRIENNFLASLAPAVIETVGDHYVELKDRAETIFNILDNEESLFRRTLQSGLARLEDLRLGIAAADLASGWVLSGAEAFLLYDTFGFPLELTREVVAGFGPRTAVDEPGYQAAMREAQERSRAATDRETVYGGVGASSFADLAATTFLGYDKLEARTRALKAEAAPNGQVALALEQTPFYAASGGQVSDEGRLLFGTHEAIVSDVTKQNGVFIHTLVPLGEPREGFLEALQDADVKAVVDATRRNAIERNHTATHLLHAALRHHLGTHVTQAGSYVGPDRLRFDFTHGKAMTADELANVEREVNREILANTAVVTHVDLPIAEARARGAMALFGEKYGDKVRMVEIGEYSRELCGGTHVKATGAIGLFKIASESSAASGVRRIEAVTGMGAYELTNEHENTLKELAAKLKSPVREVEAAVDRLLGTVQELKGQVKKLRSQGSAGEAEVLHVNGFELATELMEDGSAEDAKLIADRLAEGHPARVSVVALLGEGKVTFVAKVGQEALTKGAHAGNLLRELAKFTGGGGGGAPAFATAGGKEPEKAGDALKLAAEVLAGMAKG
jgi:alanyl-tRNA synthetase